MDVVEALDAGSGITCFVGAGGKKTTMETVAGRIEQGVITATVRIPIFDEWAGDVLVTDDPVSAVSAADSWPLGVVPEREREDRYRGYEPELVSRLGSTGHQILVKADGARMRRLKAPDDREPRLPSAADTVVPIASARVVGQPLTDDRIHRVERVTELTGREPGETITATDVATVLASPDGGRKGVPDDAAAIPLINMVDDDALESTAREIAAGIHDRADVPRVVLAEMRASDPIVDVV